MSARTFIALGTASQVPTRTRNHNGYFLRWNAEGFLFDPGEGTQRQMIFADISATSITKIFITHFHGDHCLGLAGVLQRLSLDKIAHRVQIFYPAYGKTFVENLRNSSVYHNVAEIEEIAFSEAGTIFSNGLFEIQTQKLDHSVESWGYRIEERDSFSMSPEKLKEFGIFGKDVGKLKTEGAIEIGEKIIKREDCGEKKKGQSFAFIMDTRLCESAFSLAKNTDMLVCESTYLSSETAEAESNAHLTARQAAEIANKSNANLLVLTHFSQRYKNIEDFEIEARTIHPNSVAVRDGDSVDFPKRA